MKNINPVDQFKADCTELFKKVNDEAYENKNTVQLTEVWHLRRGLFKINDFTTVLAWSDQLKEKRDDTFQSKELVTELKNKFFLFHSKLYIDSKKKKSKSTANKKTSVQSDLFTTNNDVIFEDKENGELIKSIQQS